MDILIIGVSSVFRRRLLPALLSLDCVDRIHLTSRSATTDVVIPDRKRGRFISGYDKALRETAPCLAYVSLPNHLHAEWAQRALRAGFHVIVDKPAFLNMDQAASMVELAKRQQRCLAEATVWPFHPQVRMAGEAFARAGTEPNSMQAVFSFPPLPAANFRNFPDMGGGSFHDLGAYAASPGRVFFRDDPVEVWCRILGRSAATGIDTGFAVSAIYPRGRVFQGFFSFGTEYKNSLGLLGAGMSVVLEPVFTVPRDHRPSLAIRAADKTATLTPLQGDVFAVFLEEVIRSIEVGEWSSWPGILHQDATVLHRAAQAAGVTSS